MKHLLKTIGPGLLFASTAIGTSHLVLSTRAGAHYGMIFFWVITITMVLKYPFYEFGVRYTNATGQNLMYGYKKLGTWALIIFLIEILFTMFAVTAALAAVSGALVSTTLGMADRQLPVLVATIMVFTAGLLLFGGYAMLDNFIKVLSLLLLVTVSAAFCVIVYNGPAYDQGASGSINDILTGTGLTLTISLIGFMPAGMEASVFSSMWSIEKMKTTGYHPTLKESIFDFNLGYVFTTIIALMFMTMGAFTIYGSGKLLEGNSVQFTSQLLAIFTISIGKWSYPVIAIAAFGTIYGTLVTVWDAFARAMAGGFQVLKFKHQENQVANVSPGSNHYQVLILIIGIGAFILYYQFANAMIQMLEFSTIVVFMLAPVISYLNLKVITSHDVPVSHRPNRHLLFIAYVGLIAMVVFSVYYFLDLFT